MGIIITIGNATATRIYSERIFPRCSTVCVQNAEYIDCSNAAVILGAGASINDIRCCAAIIANAEDPDSISLLSGKHAPVITCGRSSKNTISISSVTEDRISLSLNRSLQTLNGICEPLEQSYPLIPDIPLYDYMAAFAACIILGEIS